MLILDRGGEHSRSPFFNEKNRFASGIRKEWFLEERVQSPVDGVEVSRPYVLRGIVVAKVFGEDPDEKVFSGQCVVAFRKVLLHKRWCKHYVVLSSHQVQAEDAARGIVSEFVVSRRSS